MLITFVFPIFDGRAFRARPSPGTRRPNWQNLVPGEYVRGFGPMDGKLRGDEFAETTFSQGHHAVKFPDLPPFKISEANIAQFGLSQLSIGCTPSRSGRRLYYDQCFSARYEVSFQVPLFRSKEELNAKLPRLDQLIIDLNLIPQIIRHLANIPIVVAQEYAYEQRVALNNTGRPLAKHFAFATLSRTRDRKLFCPMLRTIGSNHRFCLPGPPLIIARLTTSRQDINIPQSVISSRFGSIALDCWTDRNVASGAQVIVLRDKLVREEDTERNIRIFLARFHSLAQSAAISKSQPDARNPLLVTGKLEETLVELNSVGGRLRRAAGDLASRNSKDEAANRAFYSGSVLMNTTLAKIWGAPHNALLEKIQEYQGKDRKRWHRQQQHRIFVSYRHADGFIARLLLDRIIRRFGHDAIFFDRNKIFLATNFLDQLEQAISTTHVVIAVIGPRWLGLATGPKKRRRRRVIVPGIDPEFDFVRHEIRLAFELKKPVIPILCDIENLPKPLPPDIEQLAVIDRRSIKSASHDFDTQIDDAIQFIANRAW